MADAPKSDLLQGTLDMLILKVVALGPVHGYAIARRLQQMSGAVAGRCRARGLGGLGGGTAGIGASAAVPLRLGRSAAIPLETSLH